MKHNKLLAIAVGSILGVALPQAYADNDQPNAGAPNNAPNEVNRDRANDERNIARDQADIRADQNDLRRDQADLHTDKQDLRRDNDSSASARGPKPQGEGTPRAATPQGSATQPQGAAAHEQQAGNASLVVTVVHADDLPAAQALLTNLSQLFLKQIAPQEFSANMNKTISAA